MWLLVAAIVAWYAATWRRHRAEHGRVGRAEELLAPVRRHEPGVAQRAGSEVPLRFDLELTLLQEPSAQIRDARGMDVLEEVLHERLPVIEAALGLGGVVDPARAPGSFGARGVHQ